MSGTLKLRLGLAFGILLVAWGLWAWINQAVRHEPAIPDNVRIVDGDRLEVDGNRIRLFGIDAPELEQFCGADKGPQRYPCGRRAKAALGQLFLDASNILCETKSVGEDGWNRAVCKVNGLDVNAEMVKRGQAMANREEAFVYIDEEDGAREAGVGLWASSFAAPWEWREAQKVRPKFKQPVPE